MDPGAASFEPAVESFMESFTIGSGELGSTYSVYVVSSSVLIMSSSCSMFRWSISVSVLSSGSFLIASSTSFRAGMVTIGVGCVLGVV